MKVRKSELVSPSYATAETFVTEVNEDQISAAAADDDDDEEMNNSDSDLEDDSINYPDFLNGLPSETNKTSRISKEKLMHAESLFQTLFHIVNKGKKKAPIPIMVSHSIYEKCKSKELITYMNRLGMSVSYDMNRQLRKNLASYTLEKATNEKLPLLSQLNKHDRIIASLDNFDHEDKTSMSGKHGNHDTVIVFFQTGDPDASPSRKERVSEMTPFPHQPIDAVLE